MGGGGVGVGVGAGVAGGVAALEVCAPLLLLCWLCCWPDDDKSDTSSGKHPKKPMVSNESSFRRRSTEFFTRRFGSSAASLHLPTTSGQSKQPLSAHRSHEEIPRRRQSHLEVRDEARYHSAPSVIDEVLHRRDWERSSRDLVKPSAPDIELTPIGFKTKNCKKHFTNIKSSKKKLNKESYRDDVKDEDATEIALDFYIGDGLEDSVISNESCQAKEAKQSINEFIKSGEACVTPRADSRPSLVPCVSRLAQLGVLSVEPVSYSGGACYLAEEGSLRSLRGSRAATEPQRIAVEPQRAAVPPHLRSPRSPPPPARSRHASDGDILAPCAPRPESGAFSESDLDLEVSLEEGCEEPPAYADLRHITADTKETAV